MPRIKRLISLTKIQNPVSISGTWEIVERYVTAEKTKIDILNNVLYALGFNSYHHATCYKTDVRFKSFSSNVYSTYKHTDVFYTSPQAFVFLNGADDI